MHIFVKVQSDAGLWQNPEISVYQITDGFDKILGLKCVRL